ncbi:SRPBCC domain-containing protein [Flammeovirga sp. SJP92]|uniref:SRPBCC domain-containing protein n=1 Tax=Flammeovirga sp. SJP92 TaxID=1775430 RepID=UPI001560F14C|nr:SRPBCC domain-containing protein [Flammeovirga sp. SJP92]
MVITLIIISVLFLLILTGRKSVKAIIKIKAPQEEVWSKLIDINEVKTWNRVLVPIQGEFKVGNTIKYEFYQDENGKAAVMNATVKKIIPQKIINQKGGFPGFLTYNHHYLLSSDGTFTTVTITEEYAGIYVHFWNPILVEKAYERLLTLLKKRIEE